MEIFNTSLVHFSCYLYIITSYKLQHNLLKLSKVSSRWPQQQRRMTFPAFDIGSIQNKPLLFKYKGKIVRLYGGGLLKINLVFGNNIADKGKTLEPAVSPGTKVTPHTVRVTRKLQQHSYFKPISWYSKCTKYRNKHTYICLVVPYWIGNNKGLSQCVCHHVLKKAQFMCIIKMDKITVYADI